MAKTADQSDPQFNNIYGVRGWLCSTKRCLAPHTNEHFAGVDGLIVFNHFKVQVWSSRSARATRFRDYLQSLDDVTCFDEQLA